MICAHDYYTCIPCSDEVGVGWGRVDSVTLELSLDVCSGMVPRVVLGEMDGPIDVCFCLFVDCSSICRVSVRAECA